MSGQEVLSQQTLLILLPKVPPQSPGLGCGNQLEIVGGEGRGVHGKSEGCLVLVPENVLLQNPPRPPALATSRTFNPPKRGLC